MGVYSFGLITIANRNVHAPLGSTFVCISCFVTYSVHEKVVWRCSVLAPQLSRPGECPKKPALVRCFVLPKEREKMKPVIQLNPPLAGGAYNAPLANLLNNVKTRAGFDAKLTVPYSASIWHPQTRFQRNPSRSFWENSVLVTSCHAIFGRKSANIQMLLECRLLK